MRISLPGFCLRSRVGTRLQQAVVLLLAFGLRMLRLQGRPLWYDEAFSVLYASLDPGRVIEHLAAGKVRMAAAAGAADVHPLLYYGLLHGWMGLAGRSPLAVRFLSVVLGMITLVLLWRLAAWCFDHLTGLVVGSLAAVNPFHVAYCQEARMYALLGLGAVTAAWGLLRALEETPGRAKCRRWWALYVVGAVVTLYAHSLGAFVLLAFHLLSVVRRPWRRRLPALLLADLAALAVFSPWLIGVLPGQVDFVGRGYWIASPGMAEVVRAAMLPVLTFYEPVPPWLLVPGLFASALVLALVTLRVGVVRSRAGWFLLLCWVPIVSLLLVSCWRPLYLERALLPSALFYLVAMGWLLVRGRLPRILLVGLIVLLLTVTCGSLGVHYAYAGFPRPPFQATVAYLRAQVEPGDAVVHTNKLTFFPMHVYDPDLPGVFLADASGSPQDTLSYPTQEMLGIYATPTLAQAVGDARRVWLVYFPREVDEVRALGGEVPDLPGLSGRFVRVDERGFGDLMVALYRREDR